jgi:tetratricopeptide (TPR) repeat protein
LIDLIDSAFGDRPEFPITEIPPDPESRWLAAVALGGQGWYARAAALLTELRTGPLRSLAASTLASHRRQLGGHAAARTLDAVALRSAPDEEARSDALLGLAADALGLGRLTEARRLLDAAEGLRGWRAEIRIRWVRAEIELGAGNPAAALPHAEEAAELANASRSVRHRIKSVLIVGAALPLGDPARKLLTATRAEASERGLLPLVWPCAMLLAGLEPDSSRDHRCCARHALHSVLRRADPVGRKIAAHSPWVPDLGGLNG